MSDLNDRQQAFEKKEAMNAEKQFKVSARRNKMLGLWAADLMGYDAAKTEQYAKEVIASDFIKAGDDDVLEKVQTDLKKAGIVVIEKDLRIKMDELYSEALAVIEAGSQA